MYLILLIPSSYHQNTVHQLVRKDKHHQFLQVQESNHFLRCQTTVLHHKKEGNSKCKVMQQKWLPMRPLPQRWRLGLVILLELYMQLLNHLLLCRTTSGSRREKKSRSAGFLVGFLPFFLLSMAPIISDFSCSFTLMIGVQYLSQHIHSWSSASRPSHPKQCFGKCYTSSNYLRTHTTTHSLREKFAQSISIGVHCLRMPSTRANSPWTRRASSRIFVG